MADGISRDNRKQKPGSARYCAVQALLQVHRGGGYSNVVLDNLLRTAELEPADQALASRLFYGVIERRLTLDYLLAACSSVPEKKMHPSVAEILRLGIYQLIFCDRIPPAAAISEAVDLTRRMKQERAAGFVNGVLRGVQRRGEELLRALPEDDAGLSIRASCPKELLAFWRAAYGETVMRQIAAHLNDVPALYLRVNTLRLSPDELAERIENCGGKCEKHTGIYGCLRVDSAFPLKRLAHEAKSWYYHQDAASQAACLALGAQPGERIADVCAAPGGKSFTLAQSMENRGEILACDLYPAKCETMERRAEELGITILRTAARDATKAWPSSLAGTFDRVLCDVPCSGLGVIRRKPEIRYKPPASFAGLPETQYRILDEASRLVRPGGVLQYSTCTLNPAENEDVAERFLREHTDFTPRILPLDSFFRAAGQEPGYRLTLLPHLHGTDGFFIAGFIKKET